MKWSFPDLAKFTALVVAVLLFALIIVEATAARHEPQETRGETRAPQKPAPPKKTPRTGQGKTPIEKLKTTLLTGAPSPPIPFGDEEAAKKYYEQIAATLGFTSNAPPTDMDALLEYCGFKGLKADDIETLDSDVLMDFTRLKQNAHNKLEFTADPGDILATRFFAPKITDVSAAPPVGGYGWRKVVRLRVRPGSMAANKHVVTLWLLFNCFEPDLKKDPFNARSENNQAILIQDPPPSGYWLVFAGVSDGYKRITYLRASFDARSPKIENTIPPGQNFYYLPVVCVECHGKGSPKLNYLDTDHWIDRVQPTDDFKALGESNQPVLFDSGKDERARQYVAAFDVVRQLNQEIRDQNGASDKSGPSFQTRSVNNWLRLHEGSQQYFSPIERGLPPVQSGGRVWTKGDPTDEELLPLLNQYCYRCHGSVKYNVFDKEAVFLKVNKMLERINLPRDDEFAMPQDRELPQQVKDRLITLLKMVK